MKKMKKVLYFITILFPIIIFSQVGIGTEYPSAMLDIVPKSNSNYTLKLKNGANEEVSNIDNNGNVYFKGALKSNGNAGTDGYLLESRGVNESPIWVDANQTVVYKYVTIGYNAVNTNESSQVNADSEKLINFTTNTPLVNSSEIGTWNTTTLKYTTKKDGIYEVLVNINANTSASTTNRKGILTIHMGSAKQLFWGSNIIDSNTSVDYTGKVTRYLAKGVDIYITVNMTTAWKYNYSAININYSPKTN